MLILKQINEQPQEFVFLNSSELDILVKNLSSILYTAVWSQVNIKAVSVAVVSVLK